MKTKILFLLLLLGLSTLLLTGCYTQMRVAREYDDDYDRDEYVSDDKEGEQDNSDEEVYYEDQEDAEHVTMTDHSAYDDGSWRSQVGFSYYYPSNYWPSSAFSYHYNNMWSYDPYWSSWGYSYYPYYSYSYYPWYCGTPYVCYPSYSYWNYPYYYNRYNADQYTGGRRTFGSDRGRKDRDGSGRTEYSPYPTGGVNAPAVGSASANTGGTRKNSYQPNNRTVRKDGARRGYSVQRNGSSTQGRQTEARGSNPNGQSRSGRKAPAYVPTYRGNTDKGTRREPSVGSSTPSYTPPPASSSPNTPRTTASPSNPPPRESRPAPSTNSGGNSGGGKRGGRP